MLPKGGLLEGSQNVGFGGVARAVERLEDLLLGEAGQGRVGDEGREDRNDWAGRRTRADNVRRSRTAFR